MTNFDYLKQEPKFNSFSDVAIAAEKELLIISILKERLLLFIQREIWRSCLIFKQ